MTIRAPLITPVARTKRSEVGFVSSNLLLTVLAVAAVSAPFNQKDWPNPQLIKRAWQAPTSSPNLLVTTLAPAAVAIPFSQTDWSSNVRPYVKQVDLYQNLLSTTLAPVVQSPFSQNVWHNQPVRVFYQNYSWIQNLQQTTLAGGSSVLSKHRGFTINVGKLLKG